MTVDTTARKAHAAELLREDPRRSNHSIVEESGLSAFTIAALRRRMVDAGEIPHVATVVGRDGTEYSLTRSARAPGVDLTPVRNERPRQPRPPMSTEPVLMSARAAAAVGVSAAARERLHEALRLLEAGERSVGLLEELRDACWREALADALWSGSIVSRMDYADALRDELERVGIIGSDRARDAYRQAAERVATTVELTGAALDRIVERVERSAPGLLVSTPDPALTAVPA